MDMTLIDIDSPVEKKSALLLPGAKPKQADPEKKSSRQLRVDAGKSTAPPRGKENNTRNELSRSDSMRQSLVNMTRTRREMKSNLPVPKKGYSKERLERLRCLGSSPWLPREAATASLRGAQLGPEHRPTRDRLRSCQGLISLVQRQSQPPSSRQRR